MTIYPIILSDVGGTLIQGMWDTQHPLGQKLMELKENCDVYMTTDSSNSSAQSMELHLKLARPVAIKFSGIISKETFGAEKDKDAYWDRLFTKFSKSAEHFILIDDFDGALDAAKRNNVTTVKATEDSADNAARLDETYKQVVAKLNA